MLRTRNSRVSVLWLFTLGGAAAYGCGSNEGGLPAATGGSVAEGGRVPLGGAAPSGGTGGTTSGNGGSGLGTGGGGGSIGGGDGTSGHDAGGSAGASNGGAAGSGGPQTGKRCVFYTPPGQLMATPAGGQGTTGGTGPEITGGADGVTAGADAGGVGGAGGAGGAGGEAPKPTILSAKNSFAGLYLTDGAGKALYTYGADAPGDCENPPVTNCYNDCAIAWPPFDGEPRLLGPGLDDSLFGSIPRTDGTSQTTYRGWPIYYYKNDAAPGDVKGHAVGRIWALAQLVLPNVTVLRMGDIRAISDGYGHVLYASADDTKGTATSAPVSACTGECLEAFEPFSLPYLSPVTYLAALDFTYFVRPDGVPQLAYKGAPLYLSYADERSAQTNGTATTGFAIVAP